MMRLSKALILLLSLWSEGVVGPIPADLLETQIPVTLTQTTGSCVHNFRMARGELAHVQK